MNMTIDQLTSRLRSGGGCGEHACTVEIMTKGDLGYGPAKISPHDMIIRHIVKRLDADDGEDRYHSHVERDVFESLLDEDNLPGLTRRMHLMDHIRAEHDGKTLGCRDCYDSAEPTSSDDDAMIIVTVIMPKGSKDPTKMSKDDAVEMIKKLAEKDKDFGAKLRDYFTQS